MQALQAHLHPAGTLFVVATPIGNLGDLSPRALATLKAVAAVCAEDTRHTRQLLAHYGVEKPLIALHEHNEGEIAGKLVARLRGRRFAGAGVRCRHATGQRSRLPAGARGARGGHQGQPDAGRLRLDRGLERRRACPATASCSRASCRRRRRRDASAWRGWRREPRTLVFYESAHRIEDSLADMVSAFGAERPAVLARELTKLFETVLDGTLADCARRSLPTRTSARASSW